MKMASNNYQYAFPGSILNEDSSVYSYDGIQIEFRCEDLCPDCTTPVVWVEDDELDRPYIGRIYHDATCPSVASGHGEVAPDRTLR